MLDGSERWHDVLRDSRRTEARTHVRPGLQMILHLALADIRHPSQIPIVTGGIQQGETEWFVAQSLRDSLPPCSLPGSD
jgi:hypothetical protein